MTILGFGNAPVGKIISVPGPPGPTPSVTDNSDGTVSVNSSLAQEPLSTVVIATTSATPAIGQTTYYRATSGNLTPSFPTLSGLRVGARLAVRRDPADVSQNTVTLSCAGSDTFYSSGATSATLPMNGEQREYQVVSVSGTKYWAPTGSINPVAALDNRYLAGASKLVNIGDRGFGSAGQTNPMSTSTVGTGRMLFTVDVGATDIAVQYNHWYSTLGTTVTDLDPATPITFNASLEVVSTSNPYITTGTIYRFSFGGRTTATLDPGGSVVSRLLGLSLMPGDVVAVRTYLSSGTAYPPRATVTPYGGFAAASDLTAPGSAGVTNAQGAFYGPSFLLGHADSGPTAKSVILFGDSIGNGTGDSVGIQFSQPALFPGGFALRALSGAAGLINAAIPSDRIAWFLTTDGGFRRKSNLKLANSAIIQYGTNDIAGGVSTAAATEAANLTLANNVRRLGISKVFLTTLIPRTTSTDNWATTTNQTPLATESQRTAYNTWVRAGCPINPTALTPVAVGTSGALVAGSFGHPVTGVFDVAAHVESSLNSGLWLPANRVIPCSITGGTGTLSTTGSFNSAIQESGGDKGVQCFIPGAGASGAVLSCNITSVTSTTVAAIFPNATTTVSGVSGVINTMTIDGIHPSSYGHYLMSQAINPAML